MDANVMAQQLTPIATIEALATVIGALMCLSAGVLWITKRRVSPALAGAGVLAAPLVGVAMGLSAGGLLEGAPSGEEAANAFYLAVGSRMLGVVFATLPVFAAVLLAAVAGVRGKPRRWVPAGVVGVFVVLTALVVAIGGASAGRGLEVVAYVRAAVYLVVGLPVIAAAVSSDAENGAGPEAGAGAAVAFAAFVGIGEVSSVAFVELMMHVPMAKAASYSAYIDKALAVVSPVVTWGWAAIATSSLGALAAMGFASLGGKRAAFVWMAAPLLFVAPIVHAIGPLGPSQWQAYAASLPPEGGVVTPKPSSDTPPPEALDVPEDSGDATP